MKKYEPYIPTSVREVTDLLGWIIIKFPNLNDPSFPEQNIDTEFFALQEGLININGKIGDTIYKKLIELSKQSRLEFDRDPKDEGNGGSEGRKILAEMVNILKSSRK